MGTLASTRMLVLLALPALIPLAHSGWSAWSRGLVPTGFVQYDMPYYLANAQGHYENGFRAMYGNPYAPAGTPAIYFQPQVLVLAALQWAGLSPAVAFNLFGLCAIGLAAVGALRLYTELVGFQTWAQRLGFVCFFWGGGMLSLLGLTFGWLGGVPWAKALFLFDPNDGWWMLNFGRNLVYPTEAFYHGVFVFAILFLVQRRFAATLTMTALLSVSHPFTGLSLVLIVAAYAAVEVGLKSGAASWRLLLGAIAIGTFHVGYYLVFLNQSADHRALRSQWELDWPYTAWTFGPALYLVGFVAITRLTRWLALREVLGKPQSRLLLVWFAVIFGLTQHDLFVKPMQPLHFAHGYDWMALFLLGAPALIPLFERLSRPALAACVLLFLSDNILWFASFSSDVQRYAIAVTPSERDTLGWLGQHARPGEVVASDEPRINYLTSTYSTARSWHGHVHNTPHAKLRQHEVDTMQFPAPGPTLLILRDAARAPAGFSRWQQIGDFHVFRRTI